MNLSYQKKIARDFTGIDYKQGIIKWLFLDRRAEGLFLLNIFGGARKFIPVILNHYFHLYRVFCLFVKQIVIWGATFKK